MDKLHFVGIDDQDSHHSTQHLTIKVGLHCTSDHFKDREMGCVQV